VVGMPEILNVLFSSGGYRLVDDGNGPYISAWLRNDVAQPTEEEIESARPLAEMVVLKKKIAAMRWDRETAGINVNLTG